VTLPNLDPASQAVERAALVTVDNLPHQNSTSPTARVSPASRTLSLCDNRPSSDAQAGRRPPTSTSQPTLSAGATLNGRTIDVSGYDESTGIPITGLAEHNVLVVDADWPLTPTNRRGPATASSTPVDGEVYPVLPSSKPPTPSGLFRLLRPSPDLKAHLRHHGDRAAETGRVHLQRRPAVTCTAVDDAHVHTFVTTTANEHVPRRV